MDKAAMVENLVNYYSAGNQANFAAKLGIQAQNISAWIKRGTFNAELIYEKCEGISASWLLSGKGDMIDESGLHNVDSLELRNSKELIQLCKLLIENYQQRDEVMSKLVSMVKRM